MKRATVHSLCPRHVRLNSVVSTARHRVNATKNLDKSQPSNFTNMTMMSAREPPQPMTDRRKYSTFLIRKKRTSRKAQTCLQLEIRSYNNNNNKVNTNHWF
jgi:hypothetical protein